jgi:NADH-quinone oxidoreductase subunit C
MTIAFEPQEIASQLLEKFPDVEVSVDKVNLWVAPESIAQICRSLKEDWSLDFLVAVTGVDLIESFEIVYHLNSISRNRSLVVKTRIYDREAPSLPSVFEVWQGADLQEREVWDLMGISFSGHPNMRRILTWEGFPGHPLQKSHLGG